MKSREDIIIKNLKSLAEKITEGKIKDSLEFAQVNDEIYSYLYSLDLSDEELRRKYGDILNLQDDLDYAGIPVKKDVRKLWNEDALKKQQAELDSIVGHYRKTITEDDCKTLIEELSK